MPSVSPHIFRANDVRASYPTELDEAIAHRIGRAFVAYLGASRIAVSRDMRGSSPSLCSAFIEGACRQGADVVDFGMLATDMLYFAVARDGFDGGAQVTASHNPVTDNGIKMVRRDGFPIGANGGMEEIRDMVVTDTFPAAVRSVCRSATGEVIEDYLAFILSFIDLTEIRPFHLVLDAGGGMANLVAPRLFSTLRCKTTWLRCELDSAIPHHGSDALPDQTEGDIAGSVKSAKADIGIVWDTDADRCVFIDENGERVAGDFITALLAQAFLLRAPGETIVYDVCSSNAVRDVTQRHGGRPLINRVGHAFMKRRMCEENAIFGGESSGHYYFRDYFSADNGLIPPLLILQLMSRSRRSLSELLQPIRSKYFLSGEINFCLPAADRAVALLSAMEKEYANGHICRMDGLSVDFPAWRFNVRLSQTESMLRLNLEADTVQLMNSMRDEVVRLIRQHFDRL